LHAKFHTEAARILNLAIKGKKKDAEEAMSIGIKQLRVTVEYNVKICGDLMIQKVEYN